MRSVFQQIDAGLAMVKNSMVLSFVAAVLLLVGPVLAQAADKPSGWGATVVLEPLLLAYGGFTALCNPRAAVRSGWGVERIERVLQLTNEQRSLLNELKAATARAADLSAGACPSKIPLNSAERIAFFERRFGALWKATQAVVPHFQAFYAALSPDQQHQLDARPRRWR